jgi:surfeit locus 1 family protein
MNPHDRPPRLWPVLLATLAGFVILIWLGVWQVQRLHWKEGLIAQLAASAAAPPLDITQAAGLAAQGRDPEYVRVKFTGTYKNDAWKKMISTYEGGQGWTIITPAITPDGWAVIVDRGRIPGQRLENFDVPLGPVEIEGVIRTYPRGQAMFDPENNPAANLWYWWDVPGMLAASALPAGLKPFPYVVQLLPAAATGAFPRPPEPQANLVNNHLGYAITWFGLAATLLGVAGVYVYEMRKQRKGR